MRDVRYRGMCNSQSNRNQCQCATKESERESTGLSYPVDRHLAHTPVARGGGMRCGNHYWMGPACPKRAQFQRGVSKNKQYGKPKRRDGRTDTYYS
jgi:hypothetical protein